MSEKRPLVGWLIFVTSAALAFALGLLAASISERRAESVPARLQFMEPIPPFEADNAKWGVSFPREYDSWELTKTDNGNTKYGGSGFRDYLAEDPRLVVMFAGFGFGKDYNQARGHYWAVHDVVNTKRVNATTPATCWTCKSPDVPRLMSKMGVANFYKGKFLPLKGEIKNPIGCADCHNNKTMALQVSRPALKEAFQRMGKDISKVSHQEMRSLVCAQCHATYYFKDKQTNYLVFPWDDGLGADDMDRYYERVGFSDWTHAISGTRMVKTRHPDYEIYTKGIHAYRGVSCADCHMPYKSEGGIKYTDHQIRSPLQNVANSCQVCHRWSEEEIVSRVTAIQDKHHEMLSRTTDAIARAHLEIADAARLGASDAELERPRHTLRRAQFFWDYVASNNGMGFHAPQETARVLSKALDLAMECRLAVNLLRARRGVLEPLAMPDLSTKEKALAFVKPYLEAAKAKEKTAGKR